MSCRYFDRGDSKTHLGERIADGVFFDIDPAVEGGAIICMHADPAGADVAYASKPVPLAALAAFRSVKDVKGDPEPGKAKPGEPPKAKAKARKQSKKRGR